MERLDKNFAQCVICLLDDKVDTAEVVCRFHDVVDIDRSGFCGNRVRFVNITRLVVCQAASLHMIGIIGKFDLYLVIDAALDAVFFFCAQYLRQILWRG